MRFTWALSKRNQFFLLLLYGFIYIIYRFCVHSHSDVKISRERKVFVFLDPELAKMDVERRLQAAWLEDRGTGCQIPNLNPFDEEVVKFMEITPPLVCPGYDWVRCKMSICRLRKRILDMYKGVKCTYRDIAYESDKSMYFGIEVLIYGNDTYTLRDSDHVIVHCSGTPRDTYFKLAEIWNGPVTWSGLVTGLRTNVNLVFSSPKLDDISVMILCIDSASLNAFIRHMPKSYKTLIEDGDTIIMKGYNVLGDGTAAALFPLLLGATPLELTDRRKSFSAKYLDDLPFIFYKLRDKGYRTAYFEDAPTLGTFQNRFNGFREQPTHHYMYPLFMTYEKYRFSDMKYHKYCFGDTPSHMVMLNATDQVLETEGNKFIFTFMVDLGHYDFSRVTSADDDIANWLNSFVERQLHKNTMLIVMGDHGFRFGPVRQTVVGKLEERMPLMAIRLPEVLKSKRPETFEALQRNRHVLTTAHDVHQTILDVLNIDSEQTIRKRAYSLLHPISKNRSCSEADIERHWCSCLRWSDVSLADPIYKKAGWALLHHINILTSPQRKLCVVRTLISVDYVRRYTPDIQLLKFRQAKDEDNFLGVFDAETQPDREEYEVKISAGPGYATYEATIQYSVSSDEFHVQERFISRTNAYKNEPECIISSHPHLSKYCFCTDKLD